MTQTQQQQISEAVDSISSGTNVWETLKGLGFEDAMSSIANGIVHFTFRLMLAIFLFYLGKYLIRKIYTLVYTIMVKRKVDASLTTFVLSLARMVLYFILFIIIVGIIGIETSSFIALFASAGVAIGMALSGTLQNFAGGVLILLLKPYKVGDYIEAQGFAGTVKEIQIFNTVINTADNKAIIIPNGGLSTGSINNYSHENYRRVDWKIGLAYGTDYEAASREILDMLKSDSRVVSTYRQNDRLTPDVATDEGAAAEDEAVPAREGWWARMRSRRRARQMQIKDKLREQIRLNGGLPSADVKDCPPFVGLSELADSSIVITVRAWTKAEDYWGLFFEMNRRFYKELPEKGFSFPYPQLDVHITK